MKDIMICIGTILLLQLIFPVWFWVLLVPLIYFAFSGRSGWKSFMSGLLSGAILWFGAGVYMLLTGSGIIASKIAEMFMVNSPWLLLTISSLFISLASGFAGSSGYFIGGLFKPADPK